MTIRVQQDDHEEQETERLGSGQTVGQAISQAYDQSGDVLRERDPDRDTVLVNEQPASYKQILSRSSEDAEGNISIEVTTEKYREEQAAADERRSLGDTDIVFDDIGQIFEGPIGRGDTGDFHPKPPIM